VERSAPQDHELFVAATKVSIVNVKHFFGEASWLDERQPKYRSPRFERLQEEKLHYQQIYGQ
jgi:hypothetical protein